MSDDRTPGALGSSDGLGPLPEDTLRQQAFLILSPLQSGTEDVVRLDAALAAVAAERERWLSHEVDILAAYSRTDGRREWVSVGVWLRRGEVVAHMADPRHNAEAKGPSRLAGEVFDLDDEAEEDDDHPETQPGVPTFDGADAWNAYGVERRVRFRRISMDYFGIKTPQRDNEAQYIWWIANSRHEAWMSFFQYPSAKREMNAHRLPLAEAIQAYEAIGYRCVEVDVQEKPNDLGRRLRPQLKEDRFET